MRPGQGSRARNAVQSHTGALVGDYGAMRITPLLVHRRRW